MRRNRRKQWMARVLAAATMALPACSSHSKKTPDSGLGQDSGLPGDTTGIGGEDTAGAETPGSGSQDGLGSTDAVGGKQDAIAAENRDGGKDSVGVVDGIQDETLACRAPACCVSIDLSPKNIWLDGAGSKLSIDIVVTRSDEDDHWWDVVAEVSLPEGQVACKSLMLSAYDKFVTLTCPSIPLTAKPACDSMTSLKVQLRASTYSDSSGANAVCAGVGSGAMDIRLPVACRDCPSTDGLAYSPCEIPNRTCYWTPVPGVRVPCDCYMDRKTGERRWGCPVP